MLEKLTVLKYSDLGSPMVTITIHGMQVKNSLVDLGVSINFMKKEVFYWLHIIGLRETQIIL